MIRLCRAFAWLATIACRIMRGRKRPCRIQEAVATGTCPLLSKLPQPGASDTTAHRGLPSTVRRWLWDRWAILCAISLLLGFGVVVGTLWFSEQLEACSALSEWLLFLLFLAGTFAAGRLAWWKGRHRFALFIWSAAALLLSWGLVSCAVEVEPEKYVCDCLCKFLGHPCTSTFGDLIGAQRVAVLWSPGFAFAIFVGILTVLAYAVSKAAKNILLERMTPATVVPEIGELLDDMIGRTAGSVDLILATPSVGNVTDRSAYKAGVHPFWEWLTLRGTDDAPQVRVICLTEKRAGEFYEVLAKGKEEISEPARIESEEEIKRIACLPHVSLERRDNLPLTKMVLTRSRGGDTGLLLFAAPRRLLGSPRKQEQKLELEIQGFKTRDPAVVGLLRTFFEKACFDDEPFTGIRAYVPPSERPKPDEHERDECKRKNYVKNIDRLVLAITDLLQDDSEKGRLEKIWILTTTLSVGNITLTHEQGREPRRTWEQFELALKRVGENQAVTKHVGCANEEVLRDFYYLLGRSLGMAYSCIGGKLREAVNLTKPFRTPDATLYREFNAKPRISIWACRRVMEEGPYHEAVFYLTELREDSLPFWAFRVRDDDMAVFLTRYVEAEMKRVDTPRR